MNLIQEKLVVRDNCKEKGWKGGRKSGVKEDEPEKEVPVELLEGKTRGGGIRLVYLSAESRHTQGQVPGSNAV